MRSHRFGSRTTRRIAERPRASRNRASALFAATMKLSMMSRARFWGVIWMSTTRPCATTGRGSRVSKSSSPSRLPQRDQPARRLVLQLDLLLELRPPGGLRRDGPVALEPEPDALVVELGVVRHHRAGDRLAVHAPRGPHVEVHHHGQAVLARVQRGEVVAEPLREHGEDGHARVDRRRVGGRVPVDRRPFRHPRVHVGDGDAHPEDVPGQRPRPPPPGRGRATRGCRWRTRAARAGRSRRRGRGPPPAAPPPPAPPPREKSAANPFSAITRRATATRSTTSALGMTQLTRAR